jgi:hypothetical protein
MIYILNCKNKLNENIYCRYFVFLVAVKIQIAGLKVYFIQPLTIAAAQRYLI